MADIEALLDDFARLKITKTVTHRLNQHVGDTPTGEARLQALLSCWSQPAASRNNKAGSTCQQSLYR